LKNVAFLVTEETHKKIKMEATAQGMTIKDYILSLIERDLSKKK